MIPPIIIEDEIDRQLILCAIAEQAIHRPDMRHRLTQLAYRLQGIVAFEEYMKIAERNRKR